MADNEVIEEELPDLVARAHKCYRASRSHTSEWREEARESYDLAAGHQWNADDLAALQSQDRPAVVFNRIARTLNAIIGTQVSNRQETRYIPREPGDAQVNEILTSAAEWVRDGCEAEDEESDAFEDMCTCGMGWTETRMDYESDPEGATIIERIDPFEMYWDAGATKRNLSDARWLLHIKSMDIDEFRSRWPDAGTVPNADPWEGKDDDTQLREHVYPQDAYNEQQATSQGAKKARRVRVGQFQYAERVKVYRVGQAAQKFNEKEFKKLKPALEQRGIPYIEQWRVEWRQAFIAGLEVLEDDVCPFPDGPTLRAMTYKRDRNKNVWYGIVRAMADPQRFGNKFFSQILDILNKGAKGGAFVEQDAVDDFNDLASKWARPDPLIKLRPGAIAGNKIQQRQVVQFPAGLDRLMTFSMDSVHEVTGINLELLGMANREQAGVLEHQRKQAGVTIIAPLFDGLRRYRKEQGRVLLYFIQNYLSDNRLIRITGKDGNEKYVPLSKQPDSARYDVIVDEAPTSPNMKERVFGVLQELLPALAKMGIPLPPELLDYAPIPSVLATKWKELIGKSMGNPEQVQAQMQEMGQQLQKFQQENAQLKDKKAETQAQLELDRQKFIQEAQIEREKLQLEIEKTKAELELERQKVLADLELQRTKANADLTLNRDKAAADVELKSQSNSIAKIEKALEEASQFEYEFDGGNRVVKFDRGEDGKAAKAVINIKNAKKQIAIERDAEGRLTGATDGRRRIVVERDPSTREMTGAMMEG